MSVQGAVVLVGARLADDRADDPAMSLRLRPKVNAFDALDLVLKRDAFGNDVAVAEPN